MKKMFRKVFAFILVFAIAVSLIPTKANAANNPAPVTKASLEVAANSFINYIHTNNYEQSSENLYNMGNIQSITVTDSVEGAGENGKPSTGTITIRFADGSTTDDVVISWWNYYSMNIVTMAVSKNISKNASLEELINAETYLQSLAYGYVLVSAIEGGSLDTTLPYMANTMQYLFGDDWGQSVSIENGEFAYNEGWSASDSPSIKKEMIGSFVNGRTYTKSTDGNTLTEQNNMTIYINKNFGKISEANAAIEEEFRQQEEEAKKKAEEEAKKKAEEEAKKNMSGDTNTNTDGSSEKKTEENPKTGFSLPITIMLFGTAMVVIISLVTKKKRKLMKI